MTTEKQYTGEVMRLSDLTERNDNLYHATGESNLASVLRYGIKPVSYWSTGEIAEYYADVIRDEGDEAIILSVPMGRFDHSLFRPDRPGLEEPITTVIGASDSEVWGAWQDSARTWEDSLQIVGSVSYTGTVRVSKTDVV